MAVLRKDYNGKMYRYEGGQWYRENPLRGFVKVEDPYLANELDVAFRKGTPLEKPVKQENPSFINIGRDPNNPIWYSKELKRQPTPQELETLNRQPSKNPYIQNANGTFSKEGTDQKYHIVKRNGKYLSVPIKPAPVQEQVVEEQTTSKQSSTPVNTKGPGLFESNGFANMQSFAARKNWLLDPKNADYVKVLGFNASNYRGSEQQNRGLLSMLEAQKVNQTAEQEINDEVLRTKQEPVFANKISVAPAIAKVQTRRPYTDEQLHQQAESPEYIKHVLDYSPDEFNRLMSIKTEAPSPYSLKFSRLDPALDAYGSYRRYLNSHKVGGQINYQKIFK